MKSELKSELCVYPVLKRFTNEKYDYIVLFIEPEKGIAVYGKVPEYINISHDKWDELAFVTLSPNEKVILSN